MDGEVGQAILGTMKDKGAPALGFWKSGFCHVTNSKRPIAHQAALKWFEDSDHMLYHTALVRRAPRAALAIISRPMIYWI